MTLTHKTTKVVVTVLFTGLMTFAFIFSDYSKTEASFNGPPTGRTGAPGESTCTSCHNASSQTGQFDIVAPASYVPGQAYTIQVKHTTTDGTRAAWGFELISLAGSSMAGSLTNINANTRVRVSGTKSYIEQSSTGVFSGQTNGATWSFTWTAPSTDVGPVTMYAAGLAANDDGSESGDQTYTKNVAIQPAQAVVIHHGFTDFDGDGRADPSVFRPSDRNWYINRSTAGVTVIGWGIDTDKLTPADLDGDDKADIAVWREGAPNVAAFYILQSSTNSVRQEFFGQTGDDPFVIGDWDGDGRADPAVYRDSGVAGSQSYFYYRGSANNPTGNITYIPFGSGGDRAMHGDFDGDGKLDPAVFRPTGAIWYIAESQTGAVRYDNWGLPTDRFVPADYDGDGKTDLAVNRGGVWYIKQSSSSVPLYMQWGLASDSLVPADYDGDGRADAAIYRNGVWYMRMSSSASLSVQSFGLGSDQPIAAAFVK